MPARTAPEYHLQPFAAPITQLKPDILYSIFFQIYHDGPQDFASQNILNISQVCRSWRIITLNSPLLWTHIRMRCVRSGQEHPRTVAHLRRSRNCMVSLSLDAYRHLNDYELQAIFKVHGHRIQQLRIKGVNHHITPLLWRQLMGLMPSLEEYSYEIPRDVTLKLRRDRPKAPRPFPFPPVHKNNFYLSWQTWNTTGLTSLVLHYVSEQDMINLADLREMLFQCQSTLRHFEWAGLAPAINPHQFTAPVHLPALDSLSIGYIDDIVPLVRILQVPGLTSLTLRDILVTPDLDRESTLPEVRRDTEIPCIFSLFQQYRLTCLAIFGELTCEADEVHEFLLCMPFLESLTLYCCSDAYYDALFDFDLSPDPEAIVPVLRHLALTHVEYVLPLIPFLHRRTEMGLPTLEKLVITTDGMWVVVEDELLGELMRGAWSISTISDPWPREYTIFEGSECEVVVDGVVVAAVEEWDN